MINKLYEYSERERSKADIFSSIGNTTMLGGLTSAMYELASDRPAPSWMVYFSAASALTSIGATLAAFYYRLPRASVDGAAEISAAGRPASWEEKVTTTPPRDAGLYR